MEFSNDFTVSAPLDLVWELLLDAQEVAPCVPGAALTEVVDETHYKGTVKIKLGAVQMSYRGDLEVQPDEASRRITLHAKGRETRGSGGANGTFTIQMRELEPGRTEVTTTSQVDVSGRVAQFGRGIMQDVANRLVKEFAQCLEQKIQSKSDIADSESAAANSSDTAPDPVPVVDGPDRNVPASAQSSPALEPTAANSPAPVQSISNTPASKFSEGAPASSSAELRVQDLVLTVIRGRLASGLRKLAELLEPK